MIWPQSLFLKKKKKKGFRGSVKPSLLLIHVLSLSMHTVDALIIVSCSSKCINKALKSSIVSSTKRIACLEKHPPVKKNTV